MIIVFDNDVTQRSFSGLEGMQICGEMSNIDSLDENIMFNISLANHNSQSLVLIMTSTLDEPAINESWGVSGIRIEIQECAKDCVFCTDNTSLCSIWMRVASYWNTTLITSDGWQMNNNQPLTISECVGIKIVGGFNLQKGSKIYKIIESIPSHYKIKILFKLWTIGEWQNEQFIIMIDDKPIFQIPILSDNFIFSKCQSQKVKITNIDTLLFNQAKTINLSMKTENLINDLAYWGVQSFDFFIVKCSNGWILIDIGCIPSPLECSQVRITQYFNQQIDLVDSMNSFKIQSDEIAQIIEDIGENQFIIDEAVSSITFQIQVKCQEKQIVKSFFRNCDSCNQEQYKFSNQCRNQSNTLIYYATFLQITEYKRINNKYFLNQIRNTLSIKSQ
ncbi:unnamed protein product [Paramecium sonneborni]|uniref:Uncharacterized protein n=1 Tax=Paramecium sonneborni TaxID=65129 RepID=A0A8S1R2M3_9CILI|nr:unnamed protein product [Paramecium sonneborni]